MTRGNTVDEQQQVTPWPTWVRYPLIAVFAVVVVVGLVLAVTSGVHGAVIRILVAAVVIPALLAPVLVWRSRRH
jgi:Flp pilus assembly protein TadB